MASSIHTHHYRAAAERIRTPTPATTDASEIRRPFAPRNDNHRFAEKPGAARRGPALRPARVAAHAGTRPRVARTLGRAARITPGETVLDVGCGTGSLAIAAKRRVGPTGSVLGIDASPEMIAQARSKAARARIDVSWDVARAEALPCPDGSVDVVLSTLMMHHLPRAVREAFAAEISRVLKPRGRVLVVDFEPPAHGRGGLISRLHRHGHVPAREIQDALRRATLMPIDAGSVGASDLHFALATPTAGEVAADAPPVPYRALPSLPLPLWLTAAGLMLVVLVRAPLPPARRVAGARHWIAGDARYGRHHRPARRNQWRISCPSQEALATVTRSALEYAGPGNGKGLRLDVPV